MPAPGLCVSCVPDDELSETTMPHPKLIGRLPSSDLEHVLFRLNSLEHYLMNQRQEDLAKLIAKQVIEQLREAPSGPVPLVPVSQMHQLMRTADDLVRDTDAIIKDIGPSAPGSTTKVSKVSVKFPPRQSFEEALPPEGAPEPVVTEMLRNARKSNGQPGGDSMPLILEDAPTPRQNQVKIAGIPRQTSSQSSDTPRQNISRKSDEEEFIAESAMPSNMEAVMANIGSDLSGVRQSFINAQKGSHDGKVEKLRKAMEFAEVIDGEVVARKTFAELIREAETGKKDNAVDVTVATIIVLNAIVIGISMDYAHGFWQVMDVFFTLCFLCELGVKFKLHGARKHFRSVANCLDFVLVVLDVSQLLLEKMMQLDVMQDLPAVSMFRVIRLARLTRLIRLARLKVFDELVAMITGLVGGMTTLMWSLAFFCLVVYITSLLFREFYGHTHLLYYDEDITSYFSSVPRSMYTTFRYFFGDFTTSDGISLFEAILHEYGTLDAMFVALLFFMITIGLFNVIAAIFVESTLAAAYALQNARKTERMNDDLLWGRRISILVSKFFEYTGLEVTHPLSEYLGEHCRQQCDAWQFQKFIKDPAVTKALSDLEIADEDHKYLFDILDNDNTGDIRVSQLSDGVERLRGDPRRSDIVCVDLMTRHLVEQSDYLVKATRTKLDLIQSVKRSIRRIEAKL